MRNLSLFYLATYDVTAEMLTASLQTISATARKLIELIDESAGRGIHRGMTSTKTTARRRAGNHLSELRLFSCLLLRLHFTQRRELIQAANQLANGKLQDLRDPHHGLNG
jgi:hypothetical protein